MFDPSTSVGFMLSTHSSRGVLCLFNVPSQCFVRCFHFSTDCPTQQKELHWRFTSNALLILVGIIVRELSQTIEWQWPTWSELALLVLVGVISSIGQ